MMEDKTTSTTTLLRQVRLVIPRLERITPDSSWAHRASGYRRTLLRLALRLSEQGTASDGDRLALARALAASYAILHAAAREKTGRPRIQ